MNKKTNAIVISCLFMLVLLFSSASTLMGSDFRCGSDIIRVGDRRYDVLRKCGEPSNVEIWEEIRYRRDTIPWPPEPERRYYAGPLFAKELVTIEEWEYNFGPNRFIRYLRFENGRLTSVTTGDYGY